MGSMVDAASDEPKKRSSRSNLQRIAIRLAQDRPLILIGLNLALIAWMTIVYPESFPQPANIAAVLLDTAQGGILTVGMMILLVSGVFDLSVGSILAFSGIHLGEDGKLRPVTQARTLSEAQERAGRLRSKLIERNVHHDVLQFCKAELLVENYFHAVFEATKSVADKIREKTGLHISFLSDCNLDIWAAIANLQPVSLQQIPNKSCRCRKRWVYKL